MVLVCCLFSVVHTKIFERKENYISSWEHSLVQIIQASYLSDHVSANSISKLAQTSKKKGSMLLQIVEDANYLIRQLIFGSMCIKYPKKKKKKKKVQCGCNNHSLCGRVTKLIAPQILLKRKEQVKLFLSLIQVISGVGQIRNNLYTCACGVLKV